MGYVKIDGGKKQQAYTAHDIAVSYGLSKTGAAYLARKARDAGMVPAFDVKLGDQVVHLYSRAQVKEIVKTVVAKP